MDLTLRLLGRMELRYRGQPLPAGPRRLSGERLLALLAVSGQKPRSWLAASLWPEAPETRSQFYLRRTLMELRQRLGEAAEVLNEPESAPHSLQLHIPHNSCDLWRFDHAIKIGDDLTAVSLYQGPLLEGWDDDWVLLARTERQLQFLGALERLAARPQSPQEALTQLRRLVALDPGRESAWRALMQVLADQGDPAALVQAYRELRLWLRREVRLDPSPETAACYQRLRSEARRRLPSLAPLPARRRLPVAPTPLVGRTQVLEELSSQLQETRLLTLVGIGGVGKTRLALATLEAHQDDPRFAQGVAWVDLAALSNSDLIAARLAAVLDLPETSELPMALSDHNLLIALDNCEHLLEAVAQLADTLLTACPSLSLLATSRQPLGLSSETVWRVPALEQSEALQLFTARAQKVRPGWQLTEKSRPLVEQLCQRLDDLPFAIELAAARLGTLTLEELVRRLDARFDLLAGGSKTILRRQQTLRAAMDWSWELLQPDEQIALSQLSIFISPFSLDAGEAACPSALVYLPLLVDKSLVAFSPESGRYHLLETVRAYVHEQSLEGMEAAAYQRYLPFVLAQSQQAVAHHYGPYRRYWHDQLEADHDNIRIALLHASRFAPEQGLEIAGNLWPFWVERGYRQEGLRTLTQLRERVPEPPRTLQVRVELGVGTLSYEMAQYQETYLHLEKALELARNTPDLWAEGEALRLLGLAHWNQSRPEEARRYYDQSLTCFRQGGHIGGQAYALASLGHLAWNLGRLPEALAYNQESRPLFQQLGDEAGLAEVHANLGLIARSQGNYAAARRYFEEALEARRRLGLRGGVAALIHHLGVLSYLEGNHADAELRLKESTQHWRDLGDPGWRALSLYYLGLVQRAQKNWSEAIPSLTESLAIRRQQSAKRSIAALQYALGAIWLEQGRYDEAREALRESAQLRIEIGLPVFGGESFDVLACLAARQGEFTEAVTYLSRAAQLREGKDEVEILHPYRDEATEKTRAALSKSEWETAWQNAIASSGA